MKKSRLLSILLALTMLTALLAGCSKGGAKPTASGSAASKTPETVVMYMISFNTIPDDYSKVIKTINDYIAKTYPEANIRLDYKLYGAADYDNKIKLAMQSGTQCDIFVPLGLQTYIAQGMCRDIKSELAQYGQKLSAKLKSDFGDDAFNILTQNGKVYGVPINKAVVITPTLSYNKEMLTKSGFTTKDINSIWDLTKVFAKVKQLYPDAYCFAGTNSQDSYVSQIMISENKIDRMGDQNAGVVIGNSNKVVDLYETDIYKKYSQLMRDWYLAGYMPQDMATSTSTATEYAKSGRLFCSWASYAGVKSEDPENSVFNSLTNTKNFGSKWIAPFYMDTQTSSLAMCVSSNTKVAAAAVKFLDILYTDEFITNTILYGIENESYVKVSEHVVKFPDGLNANTVPYTAYLTSGVMSSGSLMWNTTDEATYQQMLQAIAMNKTATRSPYYGFVFDASKVVNELTAISNVVKQYNPGLACGSLNPDEAIPKFVQALKDAGMDKVVKEKQTQLDAWLAANKK